MHLVYMNGYMYCCHFSSTLCLLPLTKIFHYIRFTCNILHQVVPELEFPVPLGPQRVSKGQWELSLALATCKTKQIESLEFSSSISCVSTKTSVWKLCYIFFVKVYYHTTYSRRADSRRYIVEVYHVEFFEKFRATVLNEHFISKRLN